MAPGDGDLTLTFQLADDGGSPITGYDYSTDDGTSWRSLADVSGTTTKQATITHESGGDGTVPIGYNIPYNVRVRGVNADGAGTPSDAFPVTIPPKAPDAPYDVTVDAQASAIALGFTYPRDYGSPITAWEYTTDNGSSWQPLTAVGSGHLTATITDESTGDGTTNLQSGRAYQVRFHGINAVGRGRDARPWP